MRSSAHYQTGCRRGSQGLPKVSWVPWWDSSGRNRPCSQNLSCWHLLQLWAQSTMSYRASLLWHQIQTDIGLHAPWPIRMVLSKGKFKLSRKLSRSWQVSCNSGSVRLCKSGGKLVDFRYFLTLDNRTIGRLFWGHTMNTWKTQLPYFNLCSCRLWDSCGPSCSPKTSIICSRLIWQRAEPSMVQ